MLNIKKILIVLFATITLIGLTACKKEITTTTTELSTTTSQDVTTTTEDPDLVTLKQVAELVTIENADSITEDFVLLGAYGVVTITWTSNNPTVVSIAATPTVEGSSTTYGVSIHPFTTDTLVILTAEFSYNSKTYTKLFPVTIKGGVVEDGSYSSVKDVYDHAVLDDLITLSGYVSVLYQKGYVITDSSGDSIIVYTTSDYVNLVAIGDHVTISGKYGNYHSLYQIKDLTSQVINSHNNTVSLIATTLDNASDLLAIDETVKLNHGTVYTITVTPIVMITGDIGLYQGDTLIASVYYNSPTDSIDALAEYLNREITIEVMYYVLHSEDGIKVLFYGLDDDIESTPLTVDQQLTIDVETLDEDLILTESSSLPELEFSEYYTIVPSSSLTNYLAFSGNDYQVTRPTAGNPDVSGTVSIRITIGSDYRDVEINVTIKAVSSASFSDLIISEYIEGGDYNKYIEIYNGTSSAVNLSEYTLELYVNGATTAAKTFVLEGTLDPDSVIVVYNNRSEVIIYTPATIDINSNDIANFNGNDVVVLKHSDNVIDSIGKIGQTSIDFWGDATVSTKDMTLVRKSYITSGDTNPYDDYDPSLEWDAYPKDTATYLGSHVTD